MHAEGCVKFFLPEQKITSPVSLMRQLLLSLNLLTGGECKRFYLGGRTTGVFTQGSSFSETEVLDLLFSA